VAAPFSSKVPLRFGDFDTNGHVNNVAYFAILEQGRIDFLREARRHGPLPPAIIGHAEIDYLQPVPVGIRSVTVDTSVAKIGTSSLRLEHALHCRIGRAATAVSILIVHEESGSRPLTEDERATLAEFADSAAHG
jgi:acyl-CoA thioester hydrolase